MDGPGRPRPYVHSTFIFQTELGLVSRLRSTSEIRMDETTVVNGWGAKAEMIVRTPRGDCCSCLLFPASAPEQKHTKKTQQF